MRVGANSPTWVTIGAIIAILVLVVDVVFMAIGQIDFKPGILIAGLAVARLV
jgi:hypothetical protein